MQETGIRLLSPPIPNIIAKGFAASLDSNFASFPSHNRSPKRLTSSALWLGGLRYQLQQLAFIWHRT